MKNLGYVHLSSRVANKSDVARVRAGGALARRVSNAAAAAVFAFAFAGCTGARSTTVPKPPDRSAQTCNLIMGHGRKIESSCSGGGGFWNSATPIIGFSQVNSVSYDSGLFNESFDYESFDNINNAVGPGNDPYTGWGSSKWDSAAYGADVAMTKPGPPNGKCNDSLKAVGDTVGLANINDSTSQRVVVDINTVFAYGGSKIVGGRKVFMSPTVVGWVYKDNAGAYWFQKDAAISWQFALTAGINLGKWVQVQAGINGTPTVNNPIFIGAWPPAEASHTVTGQCYNQGAKFYPDGIS